MNLKYGHPGSGMPFLVCHLSKSTATWEKGFEWRQPVADLSQPATAFGAI